MTEPRRSKLEGLADDLISTQLEEIDEAINQLNEKLKIYDRVKDKRDRLVAARRMLVGGSITGGTGSGTRVRQQDVVEYMQKHDTDAEGLHVQEIAEGMNSTEAVVRGHLNRGAGERFAKRGNRWVVRDPEAGVDND